MNSSSTGHDNQDTSEESGIAAPVNQGIGEERFAPRSHVLGGILHESDGAIHVSGNHPELVVGELLEVLPARFQHGYKRMADLLGATGIEMDHDPAAILFIALAADEIQPFEPVYQPC